MTYFTQQDHAALAFPGVSTVQSDGDFQLVYDKLSALHTSLSSRLRDHNFDLHAVDPTDVVMVGKSVTCGANGATMTLPYLRSREQALLVERLMGRDRLAHGANIQLHRHPVVELRLTPDYFAIELAVSPDAWWDQQNLTGKLGLQRHRETFRSMLRRIDGDFRLGFWAGCELSDMHLTTQQLSRGNNLHEWMSTFADGQDWFRMGVWYKPEASELEASRILREVVQRVGALYDVYTFLLWSSNNDYLSFYRKLSQRPASVRYS